MQKVNHKVYNFIQKSYEKFEAPKREAFHKIAKKFGNVKRSFTVEQILLKLFNITYSTNAKVYMPLKPKKLRKKK